MGYEHDYGSDTQTEFNSNLATLERVDAALRDCAKFRMLSIYNGYHINYLTLWRASIDSLYLEVAPKMMVRKKGGKNKKEVDEKAIVGAEFEKFNQVKSLMNVKRTERGSIKEINISEFNKFYNLCFSVEKKLRAIADARGMLLKNVSNQLAAMG